MFKVRELNICHVIDIDDVLRSFMPTRKKGVMKLEERSQATDTERMEGSSVGVIADVPQHGVYNSISFNL